MGKKRQVGERSPKVPFDEVLPLVEYCFRTYGGESGLARALADRHGGDMKTWQRQVARWTSSRPPKAVLHDTYDSLWVLR